MHYWQIEFIHGANIWYLLTYEEETTESTVWPICTVGTQKDILLISYMPESADWEENLIYGQADWCPTDVNVD